ncbi:class III signal peptide-containing protein [Methanocaldococcus indicus]|uniref:class III signal peptide-containing protein n=1 Tax=Methanocaldococcus indicus TaxID=213231 RepID=UPI003C6D6528
MIKKLLSNKGQISMEFAILMMVVVTTSTILTYYLMKSAISIKDTSVKAINETANTAEKALSTV